MSREIKATLMGTFIVVAMALALCLIRVHWLLFTATAPFVVGAGIIYVIGYATPSDIRMVVENQLRSGLDHLDFTAHIFWWPWIERTRRLLGWFGLDVRE